MFCYCIFIWLSITGTGHIVPVTFAGRLFCMLSAIVGIPLYALFLKHIGDLILAVDKKIIKWIELKILKRQTVAHMNLKVLVVAFSLMVTTILLGALGAYPFNWTYFEGMNFLKSILFIVYTTFLVCFTPFSSLPSLLW